MPGKEDEVTNDAPAPLVKFHLAAEGGEAKFYSRQELVEFVDKELETWKWLSDYTRRNALAPMVAPHLEPLDHAKRLLAKIPDDPQAARETPGLAQLQKALDSAYIGRKCIHSSTADAKFIEQLRELDLEMAVYVLGLFIG